jgi:predicted nucleic acid-binding protein
VIVLDASAAVEFLLDSDNGREVAALLSTGETLHAPHLLDLEVASVMRRLVTIEAVSADRARAVLDDLEAMGISRYAHDVLLARVWALRHNLTVYDAAYVALAEALPATLVTCDARMAGAPGNDASIQFVRS